MSRFDLRRSAPRALRGFADVAVLTMRIGVFSLLLTFGVVCYAVLSCGEQPLLEWSEQDYDFDLVGPDASLKHAFAFSNVTDRPVQVHEVRTSCGCIAHEIASSVIPAGGSSELLVELSTKGLRIPADIEKRLVVVLKQGGRSHFQQLSLAARLRPLVSLEPSEIELRPSSDGELYQAQLAVRRAAMSPQDFQKLSLDTPDCYRHSITTHTSEQILVSIDAFTSDLPTRPPPITLRRGESLQGAVLNVPVLLVASSDVRVVPPSLVMKAPPEGSAAIVRSEGVCIEAADGQPLRILDVKPTGGDGDQAFSWTRFSESSNRVEFALTKPPLPGAVKAARFEIVYKRLDDGSQGSALLTAYAVAAPSSSARN